MRRSAMPIERDSAPDRIAGMPAIGIGPDETARFDALRPAARRLGALRPAQGGAALALVSSERRSSSQPLSVSRAF
jgi:hypothetical protein